MDTVPNPDLEKYPHWVRWSEEDRVYVGRCPDLFLGGVHGPDPAAVLTHLREVMQEWFDEAVGEGQSLPPARDWPSDRPPVQCGHAADVALPQERPSSVGSVTAEGVAHGPVPAAA